MFLERGEELNRGLRIVKMHRAHVKSFEENFERVMGIGPTYSDWQPDALPLCYTRTLLLFLGVPRG